MKYLIRFLRKTCYSTKDTALAEKSPFQFSKDEDGIYSTSILGIINGLLPFGIVLVVSIDGETGEEQSLFFKRKWW